MWEMPEQHPVLEVEEVSGHVTTPYSLGARHSLRNLLPNMMGNTMAGKTTLQRSENSRWMRETRAWRVVTSAMLGDARLDMDSPHHHDLSAKCAPPTALAHLGRCKSGVSRTLCKPKPWGLQDDDRRPPWRWLMRFPRFLISEGSCAARMQVWQRCADVVLCGRCGAGRASSTIGDDDMLKGGHNRILGL